jgi:hypothetical protein
MMAKIIQFGENVPGFDIPVLNEREIRAASGLLFLIMFVAIMTAILKHDFTLLKYAGDDKWSYEEDVYNPKHFEEMIKGWLAARSKNAG